MEDSSSDISVCRAGKSRLNAIKSPAKIGTDLFNLHKLKDRQKNAEQWYTLENEQRGFPYDPGRLFKLTAANNLGQ